MLTDLCMLDELAVRFFEGGKVPKVTKVCVGVRERLLVSDEHEV